MPTQDVTTVIRPPIRGEVNFREHSRYHRIVAHWPFANGSGTTLRDISGHAINGTLNNFTLPADWIPDYFLNPNSALDFDGTSATPSTSGIGEYVKIDRQLGTLNDISCSFWVKPAPQPRGAGLGGIGVITDVGSANSLTLVPSAPNFAVGVHQNNNILVVRATQKEFTSATLDDNKWSHVVVTCIGSPATINVYINGAFQEAFTDSVAVNSLSGNEWQIGRMFNATFATNLEMELFDFRLYHRFLRAEEIKSLFEDPWLEFRVANQRANDLLFSLKPFDRSIPIERMGEIEDEDRIPVVPQELRTIVVPPDI